MAFRFSVAAFAPRGRRNTLALDKIIYSAEHVKWPPTYAQHTDRSLKALQVQLGASFALHPLARLRQLRHKVGGPDVDLLDL